MSFLHNKRSEHEPTLNELGIVAQTAAESEVRTNSTASMDYLRCMEKVTFLLMDIYKLDNSENKTSDNFVHEYSCMIYHIFFLCYFFCFSITLRCANARFNPISDDRNR